MRNPFLPQVRGPVEVPVVDNTPRRDVDSESGEMKDVPQVIDGRHPSDHDYSGPVFPSGVPEGVRKVEATTEIWSRKALVTTYVLLWLLTFVDALQQGTTGALNPYVTSAFQKHSLTAYTNVMSGIIGGIFKLPMSQILDVFGRPQGFAISVGCLTLGLVMSALCNSVNVYAAAQVFYWLGYNSLTYIISVILADTSSLKDRGFLFAYGTSPYIITIWLGGPLATAFLRGPGWRWAFGLFSIITPIAAIPVLLLMMSTYRKALIAGLIRPEKSGRNFLQSVHHYSCSHLIFTVIEFDVVGLLLVCGGLVFILLPFSLYTYQPGQWASPLVISFFIAGTLLLVAFVFYEKYFATATIMPYVLLTDRTVLGSNALACVLFISFFLWNAYFSSFLQVVSGLSLTRATYVTNIYTVGSCVFSLVVGVALRKSGRFKWLALYFGVPGTMLGVGLMIHFRQPEQSVGYIVMCQLFIAFSGGICVITEQIAAMAAVDQSLVAIVLALEGMFTSVGGGIGASVAAAIWTSVFPARIAVYLPEDMKDDAATIYASLTTQLSYPKGSPARIAIEHAYGDAQKYMCAASCAVLLIGVIATNMWRDINIADSRQTKGRGM